MPSVIRADRNVQPDVVKLTPAEAQKLLPLLQMLKTGDLGQVVISDGSQNLTIRKDNVAQNLGKSVTLTIADTTLSQNFTIFVAGHSLIRWMNALKQWGGAVSSYTFDIPDQAGSVPTIRFLLAAGS
jgi:hypothetical protein